MFFATERPRSLTSSTIPVSARPCRRRTFSRYWDAAFMPSSKMVTAVRVCGVSRSSASKATMAWPLDPTRGGLSTEAGIGSDLL